MKKRIVLLIFCLIVSYAAGAIGSIFAAEGASSEWYYSVRPDITPPAAVFPVVWNILFLLIGISLWFALIKADKAHRKRIWLAYGINLGLNALWSLFYFGMQNITLAFIDILLILGTIIWMIVVVYKVEEKSAWLLIPYLLWVSFATVITYLSMLNVL